MMLSASPGLFRQVTIHEQPVDVVIREPFTTLVNGPRSLAQRQCRYAVILGDHDVPALAEIDEGEIHCVRPRSDDLHRAVIRGQHMVGIA